MNIVTNHLLQGTDMGLFSWMIDRYYADRAEAKEARDIEAQKREQAQTARNTGDYGKAGALDYEAETQRRRKEAAQGRSGGLD